MTAASTPRPGGGIRLVASDLDGTLLLPGGTVSERTGKTLRRVRDLGVTVVLVTGRPPRYVRHLIDDRYVHELVICSNGAIVYDPAADRVVRQRPLDAEVANRIVARVHELLPDAVHGIEFGTDYERPEYGEPITVPAAKLLFQSVDDPFDALLAAVADATGTDALVTYSGEHLVEVSAAGVNKAAALAELAGDLGAGPEAVVAFGDMPNDLQMLAWAGRGIAVANAHPDVLAAADEVTESNADDGVARALERLLPL